MRFRAAIPAAEILRHCRPYLSVAPSGDGIIPEVSGVPAPHFLISNLTLDAIDAPDVSRPGSLTFLGVDSPLRVREDVGASLILAESGVSVPRGIPLVRVRSIHAAMSVLLAALRDRFHRPEPFPKGSGAAADGNRLGSGAVIEGYLEGDVHVGAGAYVGGGTYIGRGTRIEANATIQDNCFIGRDCVIQSGAVIGCTGFGFFPGERGLEAMPHLAGVDIGDGCWIGANTVVAAGVLHPTTLGRGCKLDSHVQIAHNVVLGEDGLLASQSGIAGSTSIGRRFQMGGAASIDGHLRIGDDVSVAACSGVTKDLPDKSVVAGFPARAIGEWRRQQIVIRNLAGRKKASGSPDE